MALHLQTAISDQRCLVRRLAHSLDRPIRCGVSAPLCSAAGIKVKNWVTKVRVLTSLMTKSPILSVVIVRVGSVKSDTCRFQRPGCSALLVMETHIMVSNYLTCAGPAQGHILQLVVPLSSLTLCRCRQDRTGQRSNKSKCGRDTAEVAESYDDRMILQWCCETSKKRFANIVLHEPESDDGP